MAGMREHLQGEWLLLYQGPAYGLCSQNTMKKSTRVITEVLHAPEQLTSTPTSACARRSPLFPSEALLQSLRSATSDDAGSGSPMRGSLGLPEGQDRTITRLGLAGVREITDLGPDAG